jgi:hypothetical protein
LRDEVVGWRSFITCTLLQVELEWSRQGVWDSKACSTHGGEKAYRTSVVEPEEITGKAQT